MHRYCLFHQYLWCIWFRCLFNRMNVEEAPHTNLISSGCLICSLFISAATSANGISQIMVIPLLWESRYTDHASNVRFYPPECLLSTTASTPGSANAFGLINSTLYRGYLISELIHKAYHPGKNRLDIFRYQEPFPQHRFLLHGSQYASRC